MDKVTLALVKAKANSSATNSEARLSAIFTNEDELAKEATIESEKKRLEKKQKKRNKEREKLRNKYREKYDLHKNNEKKNCNNSTGNYGGLKKYGSQVASEKEQEARCLIM